MIASDPSVIAPDALEALVDALRDRGYRVLGPTVRDGAIVYDELESAAELPVGWTDDPGARAATGSNGATTRRGSGTRSARTPGSSSCSRRASALAGAARRRRRARGRGGADGRDARSRSSACARASCTRSGSRTGSSWAAAYVERDYAARREDAFVVAVNCFEPGGTCFCVSMGTGPKVEAGYDLALTEILDGEHRLLVEVGQRARAPRCSAELPRRAAGEPTTSRPRGAAVDGAPQKMGRQLDATDLRDLLARNLEHPRWDEVAERCLTCGNCTMVCPTCFCTSVEDTTDLTGESAERDRVWDSCYSVDYSYIHGGSIRPSGPLALPAVADAQVRHLARPVRHLRLRRLRPLHHLVPGRDRRDRGADGDPRDATEAAMETIETLLRDVPVFEGLEPDAAGADRRLRARTSTSIRARSSSARATRPTPSTSSATAASRSRRSCRRAGRR